MKTYTLVRVNFKRGKLVSIEDLTAYPDYKPSDIIEDVRLDSRHCGIPRVMCSLDALYGKMDKNGLFTVAKQHKMTAPKTYTAWYIRVDDCTL